MSPASSTHPAVRGKGRQHRHATTRGKARLRRLRRELERRTSPTGRRVRAYAAIPEGSKKARSQGQWMNVVDRVLAENHDLGRIRSDALDNTRSVAWVLCRHTDWRTMLARPGHQLLAELTGVSVTTVKRAIRRLRQWGLVGLASPGSTWRTRGSFGEDTDGNLAAEYILCVPRCEPVELSGPPSLDSARSPKKPTARARETGDSEPATNLWTIGRAPVTRGEQLQASERLAQQLPVFRGRSARYVRAILRPVFNAGWSPAQIARALDHTPDGVAYWHTDQVKHPTAWAKNRLAAWQREDCTWTTPPVQLGAGRTTDLTAEQVTALRDAPRLAPEKTASQAAGARTMLEAVLGRAQKTTHSVRKGLGIAYTIEDPEIVTATRYDADDPRAKHAAKADADTIADARAAAERTRNEYHRPHRPSPDDDTLARIKAGLAARSRRGAA